MRKGEVSCFLLSNPTGSKTKNIPRWADRYKGSKKKYYFKEIIRRSEMWYKKIKNEEEVNII